MKFKKCLPGIIYTPFHMTSHSHVLTVKTYKLSIWLYFKTLKNYFIAFQFEIFVFYLILVKMQNFKNLPPFLF